MVKYIILGVVGLVVIVAGARGIYVWQQVKSAEQNAVAQQELLAQKEIVAKKEEAMRVAKAQEEMVTTPTVILAVNGATSTVMKVGGSYVLSWSSVNADSGFSSQEATECLRAEFNGKKVKLGDKFSSTGGSESLPLVSKTDVEAYKGCTVIVTYTAKNTASGKEAQASVRLSFGKVNSVDNSNNSPTFTKLQLSNLKKDLESLFCAGEKIAGVTSATEQQLKSIDAIFLRNLGIKSNLVSRNFSSAGVLFIPEVAQAMAEVKYSDMCRNQKILRVVKEPTSKINISNLNYTKISVANISAYKDKILSFNVSDESLVKRVCTNITVINKEGKDVFEPDTRCSDYYSAGNGLHSDKYYFSNSNYTSEYFESQRIDHINIDFYVIEDGGSYPSYKGALESNHLTLTFTR